MSTISSGTTSTTTLIHSGDTTGSLVFKTNDTGSGGTTAMTIDTSQNITLSAGTANGVAYLNGSKVLTTGSALTFDGTTLTASNNVTASAGIFKTTSTVAQVANLQAQNDAGTSLYMGVYGSAAGTVGTLSASSPFVSTNGTQLVMNVNNNSGVFVWGIGATPTEQMRLTNTGLGIGTSSPSSKLVVQQGSGAYQAIQIISSNSGEDAGIRLRGGGGNAFRLQQPNGSAGLFFYDETNATTRMTIDSNGYLLVGYTSSNGAYKLQVNSQIFATSSTIATSDGKYKENVQTLDGALNLVKALRPVQFSWKKHPVHAFDTTTPTVGFIAQEVQQVLADKPYLNSIIKTNECVIEPEEKDEEGNVTKEAVKEEFLGIAEGNMIALLTKALQEQQTIIEQLRADVAALKGA